MALPKLTPEEKNIALKKAQEMRSKRARIRHELKCGQTNIREILDNVSSDAVAKMRVAYLIESLPRIGKIRTRKIMEDIGINSTRRIQGLGSKQRQALLERLGD